jgi:uncharacterized protein with GYD domain
MSVMAIYISLMKLTAEGMEDLEEAPQRTREAVQKLEALGGKLLSLYVTMGEYDYVGIMECPSDEVALTFLLGLGAQGNVRTTTMRAFSAEEFAKVVGKIA